MMLNTTTKLEEMDEDVDEFELEQFVATAPDEQSVPEDLLIENLPDRSKYRYKNAYVAFVKWQETNNFTSFDEPILLEYFSEKSKVYKPPTLWSMYSMLRSTILCQHDIDISKGAELISFLKKQNDGYISKKSKVFTADEIQQFMCDAPDEHYLLIKVVIAFGVSGACSGSEITKLMVDHVKDLGDEIIVKNPSAKARLHSIDGDFADVIRKYCHLRPDGVRTNRFLLNYQRAKSRCTVQAVGKQKIAQMPKDIAAYLHLPEPNEYTCQSFRRTADSGGGAAKRHGNCKKSTADGVADGGGGAQPTKLIRRIETITSSTSPLTTASSSFRPPPIKIERNEDNSSTAPPVCVWIEQEANNDSPGLAEDPCNIKQEPASNLTDDEFIGHNDDDNTTNEPPYVSTKPPPQTEYFCCICSKITTIFTRLNDVNSEFNQMYKELTNTMFPASMLSSDLCCHKCIEILLATFKSLANLRHTNIVFWNQFLFDMYNNGIIFAEQPPSSSNRTKLEHENDEADDDDVDDVDDQFNDTSYDDDLYEDLRVENTINETTTMTCPKCPKVFSHKNILLNHMQQRHEETYECDLCQQVFSLKRNIEIHMNYVHANKKRMLTPDHYSFVPLEWNCNFCSAPATKSMQLLNEHYKVKHNADERLDRVCPHCNYLFDSETNLGAHLSCGDSTIHECKTNLAIHQYRQQNPYMCQICGKLLQSSVRLDRHIDNVHLEMPSPQWTSPSSKCAAASTPQLPNEKILLPNRSKNRYINMYDNFVKWQQSINTCSFAEPILLAYFDEKSKIYKPSTLWSMYSMLKTTILCKHDIDISKDTKLLTFLKQKSVGFVSKKSTVFTSAEIQKFMVDAPDDNYLATKVVLALGVCGIYSGKDLTKLHVDNVKDLGREIIVKIADAKTKIEKIYPIGGTYAEIIRKYLRLRPEMEISYRFLLCYRNGKCSGQPIGINKIARMPKEIANFLELSDSKQYTAHSFRRSGGVHSDLSEQWLGNN